jgi:arylsulfatase A-like enzyme
MTLEPEISATQKVHAALGDLKPEVRSSSWPGRFRVPLAVLEVALLVGIPLGMVWTAIEVRDFVGVPPGRFYLDVALSRIYLVAPAVLAFATLYLLLFSVGRPLVPSERRRSAVVVAMLLAPAALLTAWRVNRDYLPGKFEIESVLVNAAMALAFLIVLVVVSLGILAWRRARISSRSQPRLLVTSLMLGTLLFAQAGLALTRREPGPNVIVLLIDALRADHLGVYGYDRPTSPAIDRFAEDAVVFTQAISQGTYTKTSIASLFTGLDPHHHGAYNTLDDGSSGVLDARHRTLAEEFQERGMLTVAWSPNVVIRGDIGFNQGFATYRNEETRTGRINRDFLSWLRRFGRASPFFAYIHYVDLHDPYQPPEPFDTIYGSYSDVYGKLRLGNDSWAASLKKLGRGEVTLSAADVEQLKAYYDGMLTFIDGEIEALLSSLEKAGMYDDAYIVVTSDHGDGFMEHGRIGHSKVPYEELIRVPLIVKFPGSEYAGTRIDRQVRLVDVMPTLVDYMGTGDSLSVDGVSLRPLLEGEEADLPVHAFSEDGDVLALRTEKWKLIEFPDGRWEFYDLGRDPREEIDLSDAGLPEAERLRELARRAIAERNSLEIPSVPLDEETLEKLRALGYIQ